VNKYGAIRTSIDGYQFDSRAEANYYIYLKSLQENGDISDLKVHPRFVLVEGFTDNSSEWESPVTYEADFSYTDMNNRFQLVVCEVKSPATKTRLYHLKRKLFKQKYPQVIFKEELS